MNFQTLCGCGFLLVPGAGLEPARCCHPGGLSPLRLPIPPSGQERVQATREVGAACAEDGREFETSTVNCNIVRHNCVRTRSASGGSRRLMQMTPSIMSPMAAVNGRSEMRTATTPPSLSRERRMLRLTPTMRGGLRKPGTTRSSSFER